MLKQNNDERSRLATTDLRLWVCREFCHRMNGHIQLFTDAEQRMDFIFYVPVDNTHIISARDSFGNISLESHRRTKTTALVVDDYDFNRNLHRLLLEKEGVEVTLASDGKEAFEIYVERGGSYFDFILMDIQMPVMNGFEAVQKIREWERVQHKKQVDVCFVSGEYFNDEDIMNRLKGQGDANDARGIQCLRKPIDIEILRRFTMKYKRR